MVQCCLHLTPSSQKPDPALQVFEVKPLKAWSAVAITLVSVAVSLYLISISPWYLLPLAWAFAGTAFTGVSCHRLFGWSTGDSRMLPACWVTRALGIHAALCLACFSVGVPSAQVGWGHPLPAPDSSGSPGVSSPTNGALQLAHQPAVSTLACIWYKMCTTSQSGAALAQAQLGSQLSAKQAGTNLGTRSTCRPMPYPFLVQPSQLRECLAL